MITKNAFDRNKKAKMVTRNFESPVPGNHYTGKPISATNFIEHQELSSTQQEHINRYCTPLQKGFYFSPDG